jgi:protein-S-isoprenylcysteine O-methyltransferase Ste14
VAIYGLAFSLLSVGLFAANGIFEERVVMRRFFGEQYPAYMNRVKPRYFTLLKPSCWL